MYLLTWEIGQNFAQTNMTSSTVVCLSEGGGGEGGKVNGSKRCE